MDYYNPIPIGLASTYFTAASLAGGASAFALLWASVRFMPFLRLTTPTLTTKIRMIISSMTTRPSAAPVFVGPLRIDSTVYASAAQASLILGISLDEVMQSATSLGEAVWSPHHEPEIALRHRVLPFGRSKHKKVFIREYSDHQEATMVSQRDRLSMHGRFPLGPNGDDAILRLAACASN